MTKMSRQNFSISCNPIIFFMVEAQVLISNRVYTHPFYLGGIIFCYCFDFITDVMKAPSYEYGGHIMASRISLWIRINAQYIDKIYIKGCFFLSFPFCSIFHLFSFVNEPAWKGQMILKGLIPSFN